MFVETRAAEGKFTNVISQKKKSCLAAILPSKLPVALRSEAFVDKQTNTSLFSCVKYS
jgi:hypothetical protein